MKNQEIESFVENSSGDEEMSFSQEAIESSISNEEQTSTDLKEFGVDTDEPDLFTSDDHNSSQEDLLNSSENDLEEDDLEIPAFLRRQKN